MRAPSLPAHITSYLTRPVQLFRQYDRASLRPDLLAGLTVGVILLPQAIAFALIAGLPPAMGLYAAIVGAIAGGLWGSSAQMHTGPANALSLLVFSSLLTVAEPGSANYILAAGLLALMAGAFQVLLGLLRLGMLIDFVSHSVIVGFASGAGILIAIKQLQPLLGLTFEAPNIMATLRGVVTHLLDTHAPTAAIGCGTILFIVVVRRIDARIPTSLLSMVLAGATVALLDLGAQGVAVLGTLPRGLPPLTDFSGLSLELVAELSPGALAIGAIGLVQALAIGKSLSVNTGQRLDSNQEFVGQGLANVAAGLFSGYTVVGSFSRSAVNAKSGARTPMASLFSALFVLLALLLLAPLAAYIPLAALAGVLIVTAYGMVDRAEIARIWRGARQDALIMLVTLFGTLVLHIEFAVLVGILLSFALYIYTTSQTVVEPVLPDDSFSHLTPAGRRDECPQLTILGISGDIYFGAVNNIETAIVHHMDQHPAQQYLLLRMAKVNNIDFSGIHMLENILRLHRERGGDVFLQKVNPDVLALMESTGFAANLGREHFLDDDGAIAHLFYHVLDPAVCIYECPVRAFRECQNLPKHELALQLPAVQPGDHDYPLISGEALWEQIRAADRPLVVDVREPREFQRGHVPTALSHPLNLILTSPPSLPADRPLVIVCESGRRSLRAAAALRQAGYDNLAILQGGQKAWAAAGLLEAIDY